MRHYFKFRLFSSKNSKRRALFTNMCNSLIKHEYMSVTIFKAKELRIFIEPLITISKNYSNFNFKILYKKLKNIDSVFKLFKIIGPRYKYKHGGYIVIYKKHKISNNLNNLCLIKFS